MIFYHIRYQPSICTDKSKRFTDISMHSADVLLTTNAHRLKQFTHILRFQDISPTAQRARIKKKSPRDYSLGDTASHRNTLADADMPVLGGYLNRIAAFDT